MLKRCTLIVAGLLVTLGALDRTLHLNTLGVLLALLTSTLGLIGVAVAGGVFLNRWVESGGVTQHTGSRTFSRRRP